MSNVVFICDFDGTITKKDSINDFLNRYADQKWLEIEEKWIEGKVSTQEAMRLQFGLIKNMTEEKMNDFFASVEIDETFIDFLDFSKKNNIKVVIVSDGFEYFIKRILGKYNITDVEIYSNSLEFDNGKFYMNFPNSNPKCERNAGTCKCYFINKFKENNNTVYYIGDGASDFCPSKRVDFLFAKNRLLEYCQEKNIPYTRYLNFKEVMDNDRFRIIKDNR